jgi:hypothetical protein
MFNDTILLKIKRKYSKEEAVAVVLKELSDSKFKNGELLSEIEELKTEIEKLRQIPTGEGKTKRQWLQDEIFVDIHNENKMLQGRICELKKELQVCNSKYILLQMKQKTNE